MFSFLGKESCKVQLYGKLPLAKDYLRIGAGEGSGQALRDWLDRAFSQGANPKDPVSIPWPAALIVGESWGQALCAVIWPSGDAGNLRPFPFTAFVERKKKALVEDLGQGLAISSRVFDWLREVYEAREAHSDGQSYVAAIRKRELAVDALKPFEAERVDFDSWVSAMWTEQGKEGLLECLRGLDGLRRAAYRGPIRLPLVADLPSRPQVCAWLRLLTEMNLIARDSLPSLFFPLPARGPVEAPAEPEPDPEAPSDEYSSDSSSDSFSSDFSDSEQESTPDASASDGEAPSSEDAASDASSDAVGEQPAAETPTDPAFLVVFRATPAPTDATWLRPLRAKEPRRQGDFSSTECARANSIESGDASIPALADSLYGAFATLRGRLSR